MVGCAEREGTNGKRSAGGSPSRFPDYGLLVLVVELLAASGLQGVVLTW